MPTPNWKTLTLALFKIAAAVYCPSGPAGEDSSAGFGLILQIREPEKLRGQPNTLTEVLSSRE
jgi:hypothetical protein